MRQFGTPIRRRRPLSQRERPRVAVPGLIFAVTIACCLAIGSQAGEVGRAAPGDNPGQGPSRRAEPKLDPILGELFSQLSIEASETVAQRAPTSKNASVAVSIRTTNPQDLRAVLASAGIVPANAGVDSVEAYVRPERLIWLTSLK